MATLEIKVLVVINASGSPCLRHSLSPTLPFPVPSVINQVLISISWVRVCECVVVGELFGHRPGQACEPICSVVEGSNYKTTTSFTVIEAGNIQ